MKRFLAMMLTAGMILVLTGCGSPHNTAETAAPASPTTAPTAALTEAVTPTAAPTQPQTAPTQPAAEISEQPVTESADVPQEREPALQMTVGDTPVSVVWEDNDAVQTLKEAVKDNPLTVQMSMYGGFEQVGSLGMTLPQNDVQTTTEAGDIVLYSGDRLVVFYGSNTWAYTRLGRIDDKTQQELTQLLSNGDTVITLRAE